MQATIRIEKPEDPAGKNLGLLVGRCNVVQEVPAGRFGLFDGSNGSEKLTVDAQITAIRPVSGKQRRNCMNAQSRRIRSFVYYTRSLKTWSCLPLCTSARNYSVNCNIQA